MQCLFARSVSFENYIHHNKKGSNDRLCDQKFPLHSKMISHLFEIDLIHFHSNSGFSVIFLEQEISQDQ